MSMQFLLVFGTKREIHLSFIILSFYGTYLYQLLSQIWLIHLAIKTDYFTNKDEYKLLSKIP